MTIRTEHLDNGVSVEFEDRTNRYYGDYHRVCIEVRCSVPLKDELLKRLVPEEEREAVRRMLGDSVVHTRTLERMAVAGEAVYRVRDALIDAFIAGAFSYLANPGFPLHLVSRELEKRRSPRRPARLL